VIYTLFPRRLQPAMVIVVGMVVMIAPTAGPVLGGLTEVLSWKALFLINLVPGVLVCLATWRFVRVDEPEWELLQKIDFLGIVYIVVFSAACNSCWKRGCANNGSRAGRSCFSAWSQRYQGLRYSIAN